MCLKSPLNPDKTSDNYRIVRAREFTGKQAWDALDIASMHGTISTRLHWTDKPYHWHTNDGKEVFAVLDGVVEMHYKENNKAAVTTLQAGDVFYAGTGLEHVARPKGEARILVIETEGSE